MQSDIPLSASQANKKRKQEQLDIVLNKEVQFKEVSTGFENYQFIHQALPELDFERIDWACLTIHLFKAKPNGARMKTKKKDK